MTEEQEKEKLFTDLEQAGWQREELQFVILDFIKRPAVITKFPKDLDHPFNKFFRLVVLHKT